MLVACLSRQHTLPVGPCATGLELSRTRAVQVTCAGMEMPCSLRKWLAAMDENYRCTSKIKRLTPLRLYGLLVVVWITLLAESFEIIKIDGTPSLW